MSLVSKQHLHYNMNTLYATSKCFILLSKHTALSQNIEFYSLITTESFKKIVAVYTFLQIL